MPIPAGTPHSGFLIQGTFGPVNHANFELVLPNPGASFHHCWRNSDLPNSSPFEGWIQGITSAVSVDNHYTYVSLIQSNFGAVDGNGNETGFPGNLEVVGITPDPVEPVNRLYHLWRIFIPGSPPQFPWFGPEFIGIFAGSHPALIQSRPGTHGRWGNFELVVVPPNGLGLIYYTRNNDVGPASGQVWPWEQVGETFAADHTFGAVTLIQSQFVSLGFSRLEVVARSGNLLFHYWQDPARGNWIGYRNNPIFNNATGDPSLIQGTFGLRGGNLELVTPTSDGALKHLWLNTDDPDSNLWSWEVTPDDRQIPSGPSTDRVSLMQIQNPPTSGEAGDLVVVDGGGNLYWRSGPPNFQWSQPGLVCGISDIAITGDANSTSDIVAKPGPFPVGNNCDPFFDPGNPDSPGVTRHFTSNATPADNPQWTVEPAGTAIIVSPNSPETDIIFTQPPGEATATWRVILSARGQRVEVHVEFKTQAGCRQL